MHPRTFVFITVMTLCHLQLAGQMLTNSLPAALEPPSAANTNSSAPATQLPEDPGQEVLPVARPEPAPESGVPVRVDADRQSRTGDTWTLSGNVVIHYGDYIIRADKIAYHQSTSELESEGNLRVTGGPSDAYIEATRGDMHINEHTARFYNVTGSMGVRSTGRTTVYSTTNPFLFSGRVLLQTGEGSYKVIDGSMTNCRLPRPDWQLISHIISVNNGHASTSNILF